MAKATEIATIIAKSKAGMAALESTRENSKQRRAMEILLENAGSESCRQDCLAAFQKELKMEESTSATYYYLCQQKLTKALEEHDPSVKDSKAARKFSIVKHDKAGTVTKAHYFTTKKEAEAFNAALNYDAVEKGLAKVG